MKFSQLIEYNIKTFFLKNHAENEAGRLVPDIFFFYKFYMMKKQVVCTLVSICFGYLQLGYTIKKLYKISECWFRAMLNFDLLEKGLGLICPTHFV